MKRVIVDVDVGNDDAWALLILLKCEVKFGIKVEAITCVQGNTDVDNVANNVMRILTALNRLDIPVFKGAREPIITPGPKSQHFHGHDGFGDYDFGPNPNVNLVQSEHAVNAIKNFIVTDPKNISLIFVGPLTNLALCLRMYPEIKDKAKDLHIMGGNRHGIGNITRAAEFNFHADPEAASIVFNSLKCPITVMPWETCLKMQSLLTIDWRMNVLACSENKVVQMLNIIEKICYKGWSHWVPCDAFAAAAFLKPEIVTESKNYHIDIELNGRLTRAQMVLDHLNECEANATIIDDLNLEMFKKMLMYAADFPDFEDQI